MGDPFVLRRRRRFNGGLSGLSHCFDAVGDPLHMLLDRYRHIRQHRRALRAGDGEEVGKAGDRDAEVGVRTVGPLLIQCAAAAAFQVKAFIGPVIASKPVAKTMMSNSYSLPPARIPFSVISSIGPSVLASTSNTLGLLKVS